MTVSAPHSRSGLATLVPWLLGYLLLASCLAGVLFYARQQIIMRLNTPEARAEWQAWKAETERQVKTPGPVARRKVRSDEPPTLVLMRDHFPTILAMSLTVAACFYVFLAIIVRGIKRNP